MGELGRHQDDLANAQATGFAADDELACTFDNLHQGFEGCRVFAEAPKRLGRTNTVFYLAAVVAFAALVLTLSRTSIIAGIAAFI